MPLDYNSRCSNRLDHLWWFRWRWILGQPWAKTTWNEPLNHWSMSTGTKFYANILGYIKFKPGAKHVHVSTCRMMTCSRTWHVRLCCISLPKPPTHIATIHLSEHPRDRYNTPERVEKDLCECKPIYVLNLLWYWPKSTTEQTMQMYCSDVGEWLWRTDAMESYIQSPQSGKDEI